jgi:Intracellular proteinase inhibitor
MCGWIVAIVMAGWFFLSAEYCPAEVDASRDTVPKKFQGAPGLIKGGFLIQGSKRRFEKANELNLESFQTKLEITPGELSLKKIREPQPDDQIDLKFTVTNGSENGTFLFFPTAQRCEAEVRNEAGEVVYTWSEDFEFAPEAGYGFLNSGERLNYRISIPYQALRGRVSVGSATLSANLVNYPQLRAEMPLQVVP